MRLSHGGYSTEARNVVVRENGAVRRTMSGLRGAVVPRFGSGRILHLCFAQNQWEMFAQAPREGGGRFRVMPFLSWFGLAFEFLTTASRAHISLVTF